MSASETILVTGATGFFGGALVKRLSHIGHKIVATGRNPGRLDELAQSGRVTVLSADLADPSTVERLTTAGPFGTIIHCAARSSAWGPRPAFDRDNVLGTQNVIEIARRASGARMLHVSTPSIYFRFADQFDTREDAALPSPVNAYAASKRRAEELVTGSGLPHTILRPRGLYGKGDTALLPRLIHAARTGPLPLLRGGQAVTDLTYIEDAVDAVLAVLNSPGATDGAIYNISGGEALPLTHMIESAARHANVTVRWRRVPLPLALGVAKASEAAHRAFAPQREPRATVYGAGVLAFSKTLDISAISRDTGWRPVVPFEEGLVRTFGTT
ncbi:NAD-dependent epimerase/dehydratase family protein [Cucumibacter marinus]|uniref:NAD-dependent epimerase/dehydratase family protein n=1 Tax=Cucumibacter marinus TaxID=1121252 RepID=UPI0003FC5C68|nr:NAD(P)-dependent oxidoreductase [Cucumibacter marinus]